MITNKLDLSKLSSCEHHMLYSSHTTYQAFLRFYCSNSSRLLLLSECVPLNSPLQLLVWQTYVDGALSLCNWTSLKYSLLYGIPIP
jgi:hypothetical protein